MIVTREDNIANSYDDTRDQNLIETIDKFELIWKDFVETKSSISYAIITIRCSAVTAVALQCLQNKHLKTTDCSRQQ